MLNVTVHPLIFPKFVMEGYWFDFEDCKTTFRNKENKPLFEVIHNQRTHENILLTRENFYYVYDIYITCNGKGEPNLDFRTKGERITININYDGQETK